MNRPIPQPGSLVLVEDVLHTARAAMINDGLLARAVLGDGPWVDGFAAVPVPGALAVLVQPGALVAPDVVDRSDYGVLAADLHPLNRIFRAPDATTLAITGAGTWCIQVLAWEHDTDPAVLQFYDAANPTRALSGPSGTATAQYTKRAHTALLTVRSGGEAEPGQTALYVVTVPPGATAVTPEMIVRHDGAVFLDLKLPFAAPLHSPHLTGEPTAPTAPEGDSSNLLADTEFVTRAFGRLATSTAEDTDALFRGYVHVLTLGNDNQALNGTDRTGFWTVPPVRPGSTVAVKPRIRVVGGGGGSSGSSVSTPGAGGGAGGYAEGVIGGLVVGQQVPYVLGTGGRGGGVFAGGTAGHSSSFGAYVAASGGSGGSIEEATSAGGFGGVGYGPAASLIVRGGMGSDGAGRGIAGFGNGGNSALGGGGRAGGAGGFPGGGPGGGAGAPYGTDCAGADGADGAVIIEYWSVDE